MLRVSLLGNLGADPETRYTQKGTQIVSFRVAVNQVRTGPDGERQENTEWFRIRVAGRQLEFAQRLSKGSRVLVMGRLDIGHYQGKDGEPRTSFDVWADELQAMSPRGFGPEADGLAADADGDVAEPALAGVSSLGGGAAAARSGANGRGERSGARGDAPSPGGAGEDLEDLPF
ncbi:MAG TPA: single-stranded DNA-binding protein [Chloroflexota bacterium]